MKKGFTHKYMQVILTVALSLLLLVGCGSNKQQPQKGEVVGNLYTNAELGLKATIPADWSAANRDELQGYENPNIALKYDAFFKRENASVMVGVDMLDNIVGSPATITTEDYFEIIREDIKKLKINTYSISDNMEVLFAGKPAAHIHIEYGDDKIFQDYYIVKMENYMTVIISTYQEDQAEYVAEMIGAFEAV